LDAAITLCLLLLAAQTGLCRSELIGLDRDSIHLGSSAHVRCGGKVARRHFVLS
jgi:integrase